MANVILRSIVGADPIMMLGKLIYDKVSATNVDVSPDADLTSVRNETERQANEMQRLEAQAKVAQEMAIAARIEGANEVVIEEFYEYSGEGKTGLHTDSTTGTVQFGASLAGKRVSKRVYRFTGRVGETVAEEAEPPSSS